MRSFYTPSPVGPGEPAGHEGEEEEKEGGDEEPTVELKKSVEEQEDERGEDDEDEQEKAKVQVTDAEAPGEKHHLYEDVQLQSEPPSPSRMFLPPPCSCQREQRQESRGQRLVTQPPTPPPTNGQHSQ